MEQVLSGLITDISAVQGRNGVSTWFINVTATEKDKKRITLREKEVIVKKKFSCWILRDEYQEQYQP